VGTLTGRVYGSDIMCIAYGDIAASLTVQPRIIRLMEQIG